MSIQAYRDAYADITAAQQFGEQQTQGLSAGQDTQPFQLTPRSGKKAVLGVWMKFKGTLTATGPATPVAGSDALDLWINQAGGGFVSLAPAQGAMSRAVSKTRQMAEFIWAYCTNTSFSIAAAPTFASAGTAVVLVSAFFPVGGVAAVWKAKLAATITAVYASAVTIVYNSISSYIVSSNYTAVVAYNEEFTASLGAGYQSIAGFTPKSISPNAIFMTLETSTTITQVSITTIDSLVLVNSNDTDTLQRGADQIAPVAGVTYTTSAGFVICGNSKSFATFEVNFASATTHYIGYVQVFGGDKTAPEESPQATQSSPSVEQVGTVTASGQVAAAGAAAGKAPAAVGGRTIYATPGR
jgi:hypothetical protein